MAECNTTFEVSSMTQLENAGNVKALANVVINGEIAVNGIRVMSGTDKQGNPTLFASMPNKKIGNDFVSIAHTITSEANQKLNDVVVSGYNQLVASGEKTLKNDFSLNKGKPVSSQIDVTLHAVKGSETVLAAGQVKIDDCFVIKDVKVIKPADKEKSVFTAMPTYQNQNGKYIDYANPITTAMHAKMNEAVLGKFNSLEQVEYRGVRYAELGEKNEITSLQRQNNKYAEKLMSELDKAGVVYQARIGSNSGTTISVNIADKQKLNEINKALVKKLNPDDQTQGQEQAQPQPKQDNKPKRRTH